MFDHSIGAGSTEVRPSLEYLLSAIEEAGINKERYANAEARARQQRPVRPQWYEAIGRSVSFGRSHSES